MELRHALLLIGLAVVALVALQTWSAARRGAARAREESAALEPPPPPRFQPVAGLDFDPMLPAAADKRALSADAEVEMPLAVARDPVREELETLEEVATMPLNLDAGLRKSPRHADPGRPGVPDEKIDFIMRLPATTAITRDAALGIYKQHEYELEKSHRLYGCRADSDLWSELQRDAQRTRYGDLALSIQLVDTRGPIGDSELHKFSQIGLKLADELQRQTRFSMPFDDALVRAKELHGFCETFDVIAVLHVIAPSGQKFSGRRIEHAARKLNMQWGARCIFHMKNEFSPGCRHLFSLADGSGSGEFPDGQWDRFDTSVLTFFMSVPCAHRPAAVFDKMTAAAQALADNLGGELQDQTRRPLMKEGLVVIRRQIEVIEEKMRARGIVPGSQTALRLFADDTVD